MGHKACGIPNFASRGYIFRDGSCMDCTEALPLTAQVWRQLVQTVEKIAKGTDHIRIDLFVAGGNILVNEANISFLKISKYVANTCRSFPNGFCPHRTWVPVATASTLWLACICAMALAANWEDCVRHYRSWQRQHGVFTLAPNSGQVQLASHHDVLPV
eukprot:g16549.t1